MKGRFLIAIFVAVFVAVFLIGEAKAQTDVKIYAVSEKESITKNESFNVQLRLENSGESINAAEISLEFSSDLLTLQGINDGGSIINFWIEKPQEVTAEKCLTGITNCGIIKMSGLIPGGFVGDGLLATLTFKAQKEGIANLFFNRYTSKVFLDRPDAKPAEVIYQPLEIKAEGEGAEENKLILDYFPPESFDIILSKTKLALGNKWFISFSTQDKGSGISRYEIKEKFLGLFNGRWKRGESPYVLEDQWLLSVIKVKAVDNVGLEMEETLIPKRLIRFYIASALALLALLVFLLVRKIKKRN